MTNRLTVWYDAEADFLEVQFKEGAGYMHETAHESVMERLNAEGEVIGFSILGVSTFRKDKPLEAVLLPIMIFLLHVPRKEATSLCPGVQYLAVPGCPTRHDYHP